MAKKGYLEPGERFSFAYGNPCYKSHYFPNSWQWRQSTASKPVRFPTLSISPSSYLVAQVLHESTTSESDHAVILSLRIFTFSGTGIYYKLASTWMRSDHQQCLLTHAGQYLLSVFIYFFHAYIWYFTFSSLLFRLRVALSAVHTREDLENLAAALSSCINFQDTRIYDCNGYARL